MYDPKHLHLIIASDTNYAEFVSTVCVSLFATNKWFDKATIHLLSNGITESALQNIKQYIPEENGELEVYDISNIENMGLTLDKDKSGFSITSYARLLSTKLLPVDIDRVLYVDCDVVFNDDVKEFWQLKLDDNLIAGVLDAHLDTLCKTKLGLPIDFPYVNAGILLFNLEAWRKNNIIDIFESILIKYDGNVYHLDQGILNESCAGKILLVHPKYNITSTYFSHPYDAIKRMNVFFYSKTEYDEAKKSPAIIHFTEGYLGRPWIKNSTHPYKQVFDKFHSQTIWKDKELRKDTRPYIIRIQGWMLRRLPYCFYDLSMKIISLKK